MPEEYNSNWQRLAAAIARIIVRLWPKETRSWGLAFEAELPEIEFPLEALRWLAGGIMFLTRERLKSMWHSLGRPVGVPVDSPLESLAKNSTRIPRTPVWVTALLVSFSAAILLHPEVRTSLGTLLSSYTDSEANPSRWSSVKKLRQEAASRNDPQLLALLSLLSTDDAERVRLSEQAIEKDPSLTWLDYEQSLLPLYDFTQQHYLPAERIARLQNWDPDNAVPRLLAAEVISRLMRVEAFDAMFRNDTASGWEKKFAQDPRWLAAMESAFVAPKYDNYASQEFQLMRDVSNRYGLHDPDLILFVLQRKRIINFDILWTYGKFLLDRGATAEHRGDFGAAAASYWQVLRFSQRMSLNRQITFEEFFATNLAEKACMQLQPLLQKMGRGDEASLVSFQLAAGRKSQDARIFRNLPLHYSRWQLTSWSGLVINVSAMMIILSSFFVSASLVMVWFRRKKPMEARGRRDIFFSLSADLAPLVLVVSCATLYLAYHPYAEICAEYFGDGHLRTDLEGFIAAASVTHALPEQLYAYSDPYFLWRVATAFLSLVAVCMICRMALRKKPVSLERTAG
jgi:hypothetical protein